MDLPKRKPNRLKNHNYSQNGTYFLTVCIKNKKCILCRIVGDGVHDVPQTELLKVGEVVEKYIRSIDKTYEHISIEQYVIMPNHIHLLVSVYSDGNVFNGDKTLNTVSSANEVIPAMISTLKRFVNREVGYNIWQRSFHDHVVRDERDYEKIWEYIDTNVIRWRNDCFYSE